MEYKEMSCLAIHDISGVGKCSLTVALPVLSCCGVETSVLPTAVLSTHTGGFTGFTYRDLTGDILPMARHWKSLGCRFQALYTGFLGSEAQIGLVEEMFDWFGGEDTLILVDPVMGDGCVEKSAGVAEQFRIICERQGVHFLDAKDCEFNKVDFMHLTRKGHAQLAELLAAKVPELI